MSFRRFLLSQILLFLSLFFASTLAIGTDFISNLIMNFITFFTASFIIVFLVDKESPVYMNVLSATLSFNGVTYILWYYSNQSLPATSEIILDFAIVTLFTFAGARLGISKRTSSR
ncbi:MAG: hypothetical protein PWQ96_2107 [Clostridia bacterium]|jgi:hypothetical protein|nr:hypothetical protein [Clostridiales bacterium]MDK2986463.1 hypothetical protein [Clostridia bacterium]